MNIRPKEPCSTGELDHKVVSVAGPIVVLLAEKEPGSFVLTVATILRQKEIRLDNTSSAALSSVPDTGVSASQEKPK